MAKDGCEAVGVGAETEDCMKYMEIAEYRAKRELIIDFHAEYKVTQKESNLAKVLICY